MKRPEHVYETFIRATPEAVWNALTQSEFTRRYFHNCLIESDWKTGSPVVYRREDGSPVMEGKVLEASPPHTLSYTWRFVYEEELAAENPSRVTFSIEPMGDVCRLRMVHDGFDKADKTYDHVTGGWSMILCSLKSLLETGEPLSLAGNEERGAA